MNSNPSDTDSLTKDYRAKEAQLIISLKFHYGETLKDLPIDVAVDAMVKVWESCQPQQDKPQKSQALMSERPRRISGSNTIHL